MKIHQMHFQTPLKECDENEYVSHIRYCLVAFV